MGIDDVLGAIGEGVDWLNKYTSISPPGVEDKPLGSIDSSGIHFNNPLKAKIVPSGFDPKTGKKIGGATTIEGSLQGLRWLYSNGISQPLATAALVGKMNRGNNSFFGGDYFSTNSWTKAWHAANHISPGQALVLSPDEAQQAIDSPLLYYKPQASYLPPGFDKLPEAQQQQLLKNAGLPAIGNAYIERKRGNSSWFKYGTGALDFASVSFLDPTVLIARTGSGLYKANVTLKRPKTGWTPGVIDYNLSKSNVRRLMDGVWENRNNPQLLNNTELAQRSGMGPKFGAIAATLKSPEELDLFVRTGMGDYRAMKELQSRNAMAEARLSSATARLSSLDLMQARYAPGSQMRTLVDAEVARVSRGKQADEDLMIRYNNILDEADQLDQLHATRWSIQAAADRTAAQNEYLAGPARGASRGVTLRPTAGPITSANYKPTPISTGYVHSTLWGAGDYFSGPVTLVRSLKNFKPRGYVRLDGLDNDSIIEVRAQLARIPGIKESTRARLMNEFVTATNETERLEVAKTIGSLGAAKVAERYGFSAEDGMAVYQKHLDSVQGEVDRMERYTAALRSEADVAAGQPLHVDEFKVDGSQIKLSPFTVTRLINGHTFQDLDRMGTFLARHGSKIRAIRESGGTMRDALETLADYGSYLWKFSTLFRLGYVPRVLGDDLAGQWAAAGTAAMALRTARGVKNAFHNIALWQTRPALAAREQNALAGAEYAADEMRLLRPQIRGLEGRLAAQTASNRSELARATARHAAAQQRLAALSPTDLSAKALATRQFAQQRASQLRQAQLRVNAGASPGKTAALARLKNQHDFLERYHDLTSRAAKDYADQQKRVTQGSQVVSIDGVLYPAAFGGKSGEYYRTLASADETVGNIFATNKQLVEGNLARSFDHGAKPISAAQDPEAHLKAWTHAINNQIMQDELSRMAVKGATVPDMVTWMRTNGRGIAYRRRLPKMIYDEDIAQSVKYEVDQYLHSPEVRMKALEPDGVSEEWLRKAFPRISDRPDVHIGQVGQSQLHHAKTLDRMIQKWYNFAATLPANRMSRHPLFNQFYEGHLKSIQRTRINTGLNGVPVGLVEDIAHSARKLALRDMRSLVFDIAHRSDAAAATRFISPFFSATAESFQRWGRIIADKPQVVGYAANWYNSPLAVGATQDLDGNTVTQDGYTFIPVYPLKADGTPDYSKKPQLVKTRVPKSQRYIVHRMPKWFIDSPVGKALNVTEATPDLKLSQNSMNLVTQGDPWFNPGVGPVVTIPVNEFVKDKPHAAEIARELDILPFGPATGSVGQQASTLLAPAALRNFLTSYDTSDERYQAIKLQITQRAIYDHEYNGKPMLSAQEIADRTKSYWKFAALSSFLQPASTIRKDPYQFYRDQYNILRRQNPLTADDEYLKRYGESHFIFAQEISNSAGIPPTTQAVALTKEFGKEIAKNPELAALIVGPEGNGPFSPEAYAYQLNNPLVPGGAEMQRNKISADEAMKENQKRLGWAKYTAKMNELNAKLRAAGFTSFEDEGAEDFKADKRAWTSVYAEPLYPDGSINPDYNEEWSKDYFTQDQRKYERLIPGLTAVAFSDLAKRPARSDLRTLQVYLGARQELNRQLNQLKADGEPHTLAASANSDLRGQWLHFVDGLVESDTKFGDLYHRYLSRDMEVSLDQQEEGQ